MRYWECITCKKNKFPFSSVEDDELTKYCFNPNCKCKCGHKKVNYNCNEKYKLLLNISSNKENWENHDADIDRFYNQYVDLKPNFKYYNVHEFHQLNPNFECSFSVIHSNICSLQANSDNLTNLFM